MSHDGGFRVFHIFSVLRAFRTVPTGASVSALSFDLATKIFIVARDFKDSSTGAACATKTAVGQR